MPKLLYKNANIHYNDQGKGPVLVFIHGFLEDLSMWENIVTNLQISHRVICIDLLGHGSTDNIGYIHTMEDQAQMLNYLLEKLKVTSCIVAGNSLGGSIAWHYALYNPSRVQELILLDASGYPKKNEKGSIGFKIASMPVINNLLLWVTPKFLVKKNLTFP